MRESESEVCGVCAAAGVECRCLDWMLELGVYRGSINLAQNSFAIQGCGTGIEFSLRIEGLPRPQTPVQVMHVTLMKVMCTLEELSRIERDPVTAFFET